jgi:RimJ/RimL family protein N-acetyltransferase
MKRVTVLDSARSAVSTIFPLRRISAEVFSNNPASARVLEKAGFNVEARLKNPVIKDRKIFDSLLYARTK